ncbi:MAG: peptidase M36, partial [Burkholderiales bacterium]|nr:peptidase M36 [Flavobacterium sp.]
MKKITLLTALLFSFGAFSQTNRQQIQTYLDNNRAKFNLTQSDISDWAIENEVYAEGTKITSCYIVQKYQGIEIFNAQSNVSVKDGKVIHLANNFKSNIAQKVNATTPSLTVIQSISTAYSLLGITSLGSFSVVERINNNTYKLSDGIQEDLISAKLVYQSSIDQELKLAWAFQFYSPDAKHLWDLRIDANSGAILAKNDLTLSCNFGDAKSKNNNTGINFSFE